MSDNVSPNHAHAPINVKIAQEVHNVVATAITRNSSSSEPSSSFLLIRRFFMKRTDNPASAASAASSSTSKYTRYSIDSETFKDALHAVPAVYKFFLMVFRLNPLRTLVILAVFMVQGFVPALRLRTGSDFIRQVVSSNCGANA